MKSAWVLHRELPQSQLHIVPAAGHSAFEVDIARALVESTERFKTLG
jgi:proline iminopeptidase